VLNELAPLASVIVLTPVDNPRSATTEELRLALGRLAAGRRVIAARSVHESIDKALESTSNSGTICVAGSLYLVGEARTKVKTLREGERGRVKGRRSGAQALGIFLQQYKRRSRSMVAEVNGSCKLQFPRDEVKCCGRSAWYTCFFERIVRMTLSV